MKKLILNGFLGLSLLFSACNPYEDIHSQLENDIKLQTDSDAIPEEISLDSTYATLEIAEVELTDYMNVTYPRANKFTEGKITEIEYNLGLVTMAPFYTVTNDDYKLTGNEYCTDVTRWWNNSFKEVTDTVKITMTDADYELVGNTYHTFSYEDDRSGEYPSGTDVDNILDAKVSKILNANYVDIDKTGSTLVEVTYVYYNNGDTSDKTRDYEYGVKAVCEYYFKTSDDIDSKVSTILNNVNPYELDGAEVKVSYLVETTASNDFFSKKEGSWSKTDEASLEKDYYTLVDDDYIEMGIPDNKGNYNFSASYLPDDYLPQFLTNKYSYSQLEDAHTVTYKYYSSEKISEYMFDGISWIIIAPFESTVKSKSKFKYSDGIWKVSKATPITVTDNDYTLVNGDSGYKNFAYYDNKAGEFPEGTEVDNILVAKIQTILETNYVDLNEEDIEVIVSFQYYDNGINTEKISFIFTGGVWVVTNSSITLG